MKKDVMLLKEYISNQLQFAKNVCLILGCFEHGNGKMDFVPVCEGDFMRDDLQCKYCNFGKNFSNYNKCCELDRLCNAYNVMLEMQSKA